MTAPTAPSMPPSSPIAPMGPTPRSAYRRRGAELSRFVTTVVRQSIMGPFRSGRLRDESWPHGLRVIVTVSYLMFGLAAVLVVASGTIRRHSPLTTQGVSVIALPDRAALPLVLLLSFALAIFLTAALNTTWWLKIIAVSMTVAVLGNWILPGTVANPRLIVASVVLIIGLVGFIIGRWRRFFAWWDFAVIWVLVGSVLSIGLVMSRAGRGISNDFTALLLQSVAATLGMFAFPAAMSAGAATAEITVRVTVSAAGYARRWGVGRAAYAILGVVALFRLAQLGVGFARSGRLAQGWTALLTALVLLALFAGLGLAVRALGKRRPVGPSADEQSEEPAAGLGDELSRLSFPVAALLVGLTLPFQVVSFAIPLVQSFGGAEVVNIQDVGRLLSNAVDPLRLILGLLLVALALRMATRGARSRALISGSIGIMLIALARNFIVGIDQALPIDLDAMSLLSTAVGLVLAAVLVIRRSLTRRRALSITALLILSVLLAYRDFISDPLGFVLGFSGAALVMFGLVWDLLTGSGWGNGSSKRFPRQARVLLILTNSLIAMTVLAYAALVRDGSTTIYLAPYADLGDLVFGTALLAAAVITAFGSATQTGDPGPSADQ